MHFDLQLIYSYCNIEILTKAALIALVTLTTSRGKGKGKGKKDTSRDLAAIQQRLVYSVKVYMEYAIMCYCYVSSQKGTPFREITPPTESPVIVILRDLDDEVRDQFYVMVENIKLHDNEDFTGALFTLIAAYYVFNIEYDTLVQSPLLFLQEFVLGIKEESTRHTAHYANIVSRISQAQL